MNSCLIVTKKNRLKKFHLVHICIFTCSTNSAFFLSGSSHRLQAYQDGLDATTDPAAADRIFQR